MPEGVLSALRGVHAVSLAVAARAQRLRQALLREDCVRSSTQKASEGGGRRCLSDLADGRGV